MNSAIDVASPAIPCSSLGIIILVASPLDNCSKALKPCNVTYAASEAAWLIYAIPLACASYTKRMLLLPLQPLLFLLLYQHLHVR